MKAICIGAAALIACATVSQAQAATFTDEIVEWVIEPCMEVAAALDVARYDKETIDAGVKRTHIADVMVASREAATEQMAGQIKAGASWEARRAAYPLLLKLCIAQFTDEE